MSQTHSPIVRTARRLRASVSETLRHVRRNAGLYLLFALLCVMLNQYFAMNWTDSVAARLAWIDRGVLPQRDDMVVFRFEGEGIVAKLNGMRFLKHVRGVPGDRVKVVGRTVYVNEIQVGEALERTPSGKVLDAIGPLVIPPGFYFIAGETVTSLDSRYVQVGLVPARRIEGRAVPLL